MTQRIDHESRTILNFEEKHVSSYQVIFPNQMYHFKEAKIRVTPEWLHRKYESINFLTIIKGWWLEGNFRSKSTRTRWKTSKFQNIILIMVILMSRIFGRKDASHFPDK